MARGGAGGGSSTNEEPYNGKELIDSHGLNCYHYWTPYYDVAIARWTSMDLADEFHSVYVDVGGDPVNPMDPLGTESRRVVGRDAGNLILPVSGGVYPFCRFPSAPSTPRGGGR